MKLTGWSVLLARTPSTIHVALDVALQESTYCEAEGLWRGFQAAEQACLADGIHINNLHTTTSRPGYRLATFVLYRYMNIPISYTLHTARQDRSQIATHFYPARRQQGWQMII